MKHDPNDPNATIVLKPGEVGTDLMLVDPEGLDPVYETPEDGRASTSPPRGKTMPPPLPAHPSTAPSLTPTVAPPPPAGRRPFVLVAVLVGLLAVGLVAGRFVAHIHAKGQPPVVPSASASTAVITIPTVELGAPAASAE